MFASLSTLNSLIIAERYILELHTYLKSDWEKQEMKIFFDGVFFFKRKRLANCALYLENDFKNAWTGRRSNPPTKCKWTQGTIFFHQFYIEYVCNKHLTVDLAENRAVLLKKGSPSALEDQL